MEIYENDGLVLNANGGGDNALSSWWLVVVTSLCSAFSVEVAVVRLFIVHLAESLGMGSIVSGGM